MRPGCLPCHNLHILTDRHIGSDFYSQPGDSHTSSGRTHMPVSNNVSVSLKEAHGGLFFCLSPFDFIFLYLLAMNCSTSLAHQTLYVVGFSVCSFVTTGVVKDWALGITHQSWRRQGTSLETLLKPHFQPHIPAHPWGSQPTGDSSW